MRANRFLPALLVAVALPLWAWAQAPAPAPTPAPAEPAPTPAEAVLDAAIAKVKALESVAADIRQDVKMLGLKFQVTGRYVRAPQYKVYLQLQVAGLANNPGSMIQVSDGAVFWEYKKVLDAPDLRKRELAPILTRLNSPDCDPELRDRVLAQLGFAGPDALLRGLREAIAFDQQAEGEYEGRKVWILRGRWKDRARLSAPEQPQLPPTAPLPPYVPSLASVWIDQETGWPYQVRLSGKALGIMDMKKDIRELGPDGRPIGRPMAPPSIEPSEFVLTYSDVQLNPALGPSEFFYQPPSQVQVVDETQAIATDLDNALAERAARRKADAAREAGDLPKSIPVPSPSALPPPADATAPSAPPR